MNTTLQSIHSVSRNNNLLILSTDQQLAWAKDYLSEVEVLILTTAVQKGSKQILFPQQNRWIIIEIITLKNNRVQNQELVRRVASKSLATLKHHKLDKAVFIDATDEGNYAAYYATGLVLANYQFLKYFTTSDKLKSSFDTLYLLEKNIYPSELEQLNNYLKGICVARDLVNEPLSFLTAVQFGEEIERLADEAGFEVQVLDKQDIEALGMGGLLAVNRGSVVPPTFSILEWNPSNKTNAQAIVLVGKGVVYDTGGLSLKPTPNSMDFMKSDMGGAAAVVGAIYAIAKNKLPIHVIGLIPATDNRPGLDAYVPGDVIEMYSGATVEVLNTDAEGRLILADALHYAKQYNPSLVIDLATLTGSAPRAIGNLAAVLMGNASNEIKNALTTAGWETYERLVEFPLWDEYGDMIKSDIADLKNLGGADAGAITAGKFLEYFVAYEWLHLDIAGPAYLHYEDAYRVKGGTGYGVQLLYNFLSNFKA